MIWLAVAAGGAIGSAFRHGVGVLYTRVIGQPVPFATATVNIVGCAVIGGLAGLVSTGALRLSTEARAFWFVGILGGFTTFSSFALDTLTLAHGGQRARALANVAVQVGAGIAAAFVAFSAVTSR